MKQSKRLRFGRFYTPPGVADLTLGLAVRSESDRIWDPTCGDGSFLRRAVHRGHSPELLFGHDVDPAAVSATRDSVPGAHVEHADLFSLEPEQTGLFDAIAGNPPFVRVERLPSERRNALRRRTSEALGFTPPAQTDLSVLSLLQCLRFLAPGGRLAFVMPNTWMDADFSKPLRRWLMQHYSLRAVVESRCEPWFPQARVNTVVVVFEASSSTRQPTFARCLAPASAALAPGILGDAPADPSCLQLRRAPAAQERWSTLLRAPDLWFEIHERAGEHLVALGDPERPVLRKAYGTKVGISGFFSPRRTAQFDRVGVEPSFRRPFLRSLRGLHRYSIRPEDVDGEVFVCEERPDPEQSPGAAAWIEWGEQQISTAGLPWPQVPSVQGNLPWFALRELRGGDVVIPQFRMDRHYVLENPHHVPVNNSAWWGEWLQPEHAELGVALLNSTWIALASEVLGRVNLGEGLLTCYGPDLDALPLPDPGVFAGTRAGDKLLAAWRQLRRRKVLPLREEVLRGDRRALDEAVAEGLGLPAGLGRQIGREASRLCSERLSLAAALRSARRRAEA